MKFKFTPFIIFIFSMIFSSCEKVEIGESFDTRVGLKNKVTYNLSFTIDSVYDFRCPYPLYCLWDGDAKMFLRFNKPFNHIDTAIYRSNRDRNPIQIEGYEFKVLNLNPRREVDKKISQNEYLISMIVQKI